MNESRLNDFGLTEHHELLRRIVIVILAFGGALEVMYSVAFNPPDWTDAVAITLTALATAWILLVRWETASPRLIALPLLLGIAAVVMIVIGDGVAVGMSFLFIPAAVVMIFFWRDPLVKFLVMVPLAAAFVIVPVVWGDRAAVIEAVTMLPLLLVISLIVGAMFDRFRNATVEQARFRGTITALLMALDARDEHSTEHSSEVLTLVMSVAEDLGLDEKQALHAADVALLHDVGRIGVPDEILDKPAPLDAQEWELVRRHPEIGERILREVPGFEEVASAVRHEHEHWDGSGYPDGLKGEEIPVASRIVLACDAYNAMVSERPYRRALTHEQAREQLKRHAGTQFDPAVVRALVTALERCEGRPLPVRPTRLAAIEDDVVDSLRMLKPELQAERTV